MEYVVLHSVHPSALAVHLPKEVAQMIGFDPGGEGTVPASRSISFFRRSPGIARVVATYPAREALAIETLRDRFLATARPAKKGDFALPVRLSDYLGMTVRSPPNGKRSTPDRVLWFASAPEYYDYRAAQDRRVVWTGPSGGGLAHVYLMRSVLSFPARELSQLQDLEARIEADEWRPGIEALQRVARGRRSGSTS